MKIKNEDSLLGARSRLALAQVCCDEFKVVDIDEIYDGPVSGICSRNNIEYYFYCFGLNQSHEREYLLIALTQQQKELLSIEFSKFREYKTGLIALDEYSSWSNQEPLQFIEDNQLIGWFSVDQNNMLKKNGFMASYFEWRDKQS